MRKSIWAVVAGFMFVFAVTTIVDVALHAAGVYPPLGAPMNDAASVLASSYRLVIGIAGGWLTALLAPSNPMKHSLILGAVGTILGAIGAAVTWNSGLAPTWYPVSIALLALPQCWIGGKIFVAISAKD